MSGHSKWSQIKYKKAITDAQKGRLFTKLANAITLAAREGGDPEANFKLKAAIEKAKEQNMPTANIERAIKRGTGELEGARIEETTYEGYGPAGVALIISVITDNKNRAVSEIRNILNKAGGKLGQPGSVAYLFEQKGVIHLEVDSASQEEAELLAIDAGAEDISNEGNNLFVYTKPNELFLVKKNLEAKGPKVVSASLSMEPKTTVKVVDLERARQVLKMMDALDECQDVANVYANFDIPDEVLHQVSGS